MADAETQEKDPTVLYRATVKTKDGRTATSQVAAVFGAAMGNVDPKDQYGGAILYRFRLLTADGKEHISRPVPGERAKFVATDLKWGKTDHEHGGETTMTAKVKYDGGRPVRFVVQHDHYGSWIHYATVPAVVKDGVATGKLTVHHPALHPSQGSAPDRGEEIDPAHLRFKVEVGDAELPPVLESEPADKPAGEQEEKDDGKFKATDFEWADDEHEHGSTTTMTAKVVNDGGKPVRFVVESNHDGNWQHYATVPATVFEGVATAQLSVHHPLLVPGRPKPTRGQVHNAEAAKLRFRVELGEAHAQKPPVKDVPELPKAHPKPGEVPLKLKVHDPDGHPHESRPFEIQLAGGKVIKGTTTKDGIVLARVPKGKPAKLVVQGKEGPHVVQLQLGKLEAPETIKGAQQRLLSLGYKLGVSGKIDAATKKALALFKQDHALPGKAEIASLARHIHAAYLGK